MRVWKPLSLTSLAAVAIISANLMAAYAERTPAGFTQSQARATRSAPTQPNSLCAKTERIVFSCGTKRSGASAARGPSKIVSLCASRDLDKEHGYLQYRYGLPGKVELEFPSSQTGTQQLFQHTHYMRYQVDLTEINFEINGFQYQIFDDYNGEEKPPIATAGVNVTSPGRPREAAFICRTKAKADFNLLEDVLPREE